MERWISAEPGVKIYINDVNPMGRDPVLFLHGWPVDSRIFEYQYNVLGDLGIRCIGMDFRGFGSSDKPHGGYRYDRLADDVRSVLEMLGLPGVTLAGHSTGGAVAIRYMARHKGYGVKKLALCAAAAPSIVEKADFPHGLKNEDIYDMIKLAYRDRPRMLCEFASRVFHSNVSQELMAWFHDLGLSAASWATIAMARALLVETASSKDLAAIDVPTLIMQGAHDRFVRYPLAVALNEAIADSKLVVFENSGHGLFYDEKEKFNRVLAEFAG